jgi:hypothetical protein
MKQSLEYLRNCSFPPDAARAIDEMMHRMYRLEYQLAASRRQVRELEQRLVDIEAI